jgi:hypothetical protein
VRITEINEATAYHGSAADFETFDGDFVGTGDGAMTFGWGIYLTQSKRIARMFVKRGVGKMFEVEMPDPDEMLDWDKPFSEQSSHVQQALLKMKYPELREKAKEEEVVSGYDDDFHHDTGEEMYGLICSMQDFSIAGDNYTQRYTAHKRRCSGLFLKAGIAGIKYLDVIKYRGDYNYVIFDPSRIRVKKKS